MAIKKNRDMLMEKPTQSPYATGQVTPIDSINAMYKMNPNQTYQQSRDTQGQIYKQSAIDKLKANPYADVKNDFNEAGFWGGTGAQTEIQNAARQSFMEKNAPIKLPSDSNSTWTGAERMTNRRRMALDMNNLRSGKYSPEDIISINRMRGVGENGQPMQVNRGGEPVINYNMTQLETAVPLGIQADRAEARAASNKSAMESAMYQDPTYRQAQIDKARRDVAVDPMLEYQMSGIDKQLDTTTSEIEFYKQQMQADAAKGLDTSKTRAYIESLTQQRNNLFEKRMSLFGGNISQNNPMMDNTMVQPNTPAMPIPEPTQDHSVKMGRDLEYATKVGFDTSEFKDAYAGLAGNETYVNDSTDTRAIALVASTIENAIRIGMSPEMIVQRLQTMGDYNKLVANAKRSGDPTLATRLMAIADQLGLTVQDVYSGSFPMTNSIVQGVKKFFN